MLTRRRETHPWIKGGASHHILRKEEISKPTSIFIYIYKHTHTYQTSYHFVNGERKKTEQRTMSSSRELQYLEYTYRNNRPTTGLLNSIFMTTVNTAARSLVSVASTASTPELASRRWSASEHLRFMSMMMTWLTLWVLRVFLDYLPLPLISTSSSYSPFSFASGLLTAAAENALVPKVSASSPSTSTALVKYSPSSDLGMMICDGVDEPSVNSLGRALCHVSFLIYNISLFGILVLIYVNVFNYTGLKIFSLVWLGRPTMKCWFHVKLLSVLDLVIFV